MNFNCCIKTHKKTATKNSKIWQRFLSYFSMLKLICMFSLLIDSQNNALSHAKILPQFYTFPICLYLFIIFPFLFRFLFSKADLRLCILKAVWYSLNRDSEGSSKYTIRVILFLFSGKVIWSRWIYIIQRHLIIHWPEPSFCSGAIEISVWSGFLLFAPNSRATHKFYCVYFLLLFWWRGGGGLVMTSHPGPNIRKSAKNLTEIFGFFYVTAHLRVFIQHLTKMLFIT